MPKDNPATFNQAIMFGALQCVPKTMCICVFNDSCAAFKKKESRPAACNLRS
jgi:adenine-specific DNA glycosylase